MPGRDTLSCHMDCKIRYLGRTEMVFCRGRNEDLDSMYLTSKWLMALKSDSVAGFGLHV